MNRHDEVVRIKESVEAEILEIPCVTGIDVGYVSTEADTDKELAIRIFVSSLQDLPQELADMREIEGVPVVFIERGFELL